MKILMENLKERSLRVQKEEKSRPRWFLFRAPAGKDRIRTFRFFLYSVSLGLRPCWGADMRGRMFSNISDVPAGADPVFLPAEEVFGLRPFRLRLLSVAQAFPIQLIGM